MVNSCQEVGYVVKCVGVAIDDGLTWKEHITLARKKSFGAFGKATEIEKCSTG